jgi:DNA polymerase III sliding clamp (beta) subunit (PCNA family)
MIVNYRYILDVLDVIETENIIIKLVDERSPIIIVPENDKNYLYIVMPILRENQ